MKWLKIIFSTFGLFVIIDVRKVNTNEISAVPDILGCQEFRTRAETYVNFFALDYFTNEKVENEEIFRYKFYVKGDQDLYILFTESDNANSGTQCYEFGLKSSKPPTSTYGSSPLASTLRTKIEGSQRVRTEESLPLSKKNPMAVTIIQKDDGEVQLIAGDKPYPLLRFPYVPLNATFISFATRNNLLGYFYFNCGNKRQKASSGTDIVIPEKHDFPVAYISFRVNSISRHHSDVKVNLFYNMTFYPDTQSELGSNNVTIASNTSFQIPQLNIYSNRQGAKRAEPKFNFAIDSNKRLITSASQDIDMSCPHKWDNLLYCNLAFGIEGKQYHLSYFPDGPLFSSQIAQYADIKIYQSANSISISTIPLKDDIEMIFKLDRNKV